MNERRPLTCHKSPVGAVVNVRQCYEIIILIKKSVCANGCFLC